MTWMGIRLSSGSRCPQSPKAFHCTYSIGFLRCKQAITSFDLLTETEAKRSMSAKAIYQ